MKQESVIEAVKHVRLPGSAWLRAFPSILNHTEITIRFRLPSGDEGTFDKQILHSQTTEAECLEECRKLWLQAAAAMFDERNRSFAGMEYAARQAYQRTEAPAGVNVKIG